MLDRLVEALLQFLDLFKVIRVVQPWEKALVLRMGRVVREVPPGWYWVWPLSVDHVLACSVTLDTEHLRAQSLTTADGHSVTVAGIITYRVTDIHKAMIEVQGVKETLSDTAYGVVKNLVAAAPLDELSGEALEAKLTRTIKRKALPYGLDIVRVQLSDCAKMKSLRLVQG